jgi:hypothetical protein
MLYDFDYLPIIPIDYEFIADATFVSSNRIICLPSP